MSIYQSIYKGLGQGKSIFYAWFEMMHTRVDLVFCHGEETKLRSIVTDMAEELLRLENLVNRFNRGSELSRLNNKAFSCPVKVSEELFSMIQYCIDSCYKTFGYFDITVNSKNGYRDGIKNIILDDYYSTVQFLHPDIKLDLCGYIKGYALDRMKKLIQNKVSDALLSLGNSSVMALGNHPYGKGWKIAINAQNYPYMMPKSIVLHNECFTSSGNSPVNSKHIICPETGKYIENEEIISLITLEGIEGEIFSTALFAASLPDREKISRKFSLKVIS